MTSSHDLKLRTRLPYERVEHLLTACCTKLYSMTLDGIDMTDRGPCKVMKISFEDPADRERFRNAFQKAHDQASASPPPRGGKSSKFDARAG
jgi:hypothetical protein